MPLPLEQRIRELEGRVCAIEKILRMKIGISPLELMGKAGATSIFSEALMGASLLYADREGISLRVIESSTQITPGTRQCWFNPATGTVSLDPTNPINDGGEVFWLIYSKK